MKPLPRDKVECRKCGRHIKLRWETCRHVNVLQFFIPAASPVGPTCRKNLIRLGAAEDSFLQVPHAKR